jgi:hypothetical protein
MDTPTKKDPSPGKLPKHMVRFPIYYLVVLVVIACLFGIYGNSLPYFFKHPYGEMPVSVIWFGALGGTMASLNGIFMHGNDWNDSYDLWHKLSAPVGAVIGLLSYILLVALINSTSGSSSINTNAIITFDLAAFILGYSQQHFQQLLDKAFGVIFGPGSDNNTK